MSKKYIYTGVLAAALAITPTWAMAQSSAQNTEKKDKFDKAGDATEGALETAGDATEKGLDAAGKGVGAAVEHTGRGVTNAGKATGGAMKDAGKAVADFFDGDDSADQDKVKEVQLALQAKGYHAGPIDGLVGPKTRSGLSEFQKDEGLKVTGKVNGQTAERLGVD